MKLKILAVILVEQPKEAPARRSQTSSPRLFVGMGFLSEWNCAIPL